MSRNFTTILARWELSGTLFDIPQMSLCDVMAVALSFAFLQIRAQEGLQTCDGGS